MSEQKEIVLPPAFSPSAGTISIEGRNFVDDKGRVLHLRGANVSSSSKVPNDPKPLLHDHTQASYVGRPFPLDQASEHWRRLKSWGLTFVRINVTWEAIEHAGPGKYDLEYLDYLRALVKSMAEYGLVCYIAVHQDVWSRYTGGSGAPGWTLEVAGFDLSNDGEALVKSGAAFLDGIRGGRLQGERGLWPTGYQKLAAASMNTFFWAGETFAPGLQIQGKNVQAFLQDAFIAAFGKLIDAVGDLDSVIGFELLNEPHPGYIGLPTVHEWNYNTDLHLGDFPSPLQSFSMGAGHRTAKIPHYTRSFPFPTRVDRYIEGNPTSVSAWKGACPWEQAGVWRWSETKSKPVALQDDYFTKDSTGRKVDFYKDFYWPFIRRWESLVASKAPSKARMVEPIPNEYCPAWPVDSRPANLVYAPHCSGVWNHAYTWYDLNALFKKQMGYFTINVQGLARGMFPLKAVYRGKAVKDNYALQIRNIVQEARKQIGEVPIVFGESGVPMDLNKEEALKTGDWKWQQRMMDALISAYESSLVGFNLWTYNPANRDDIGDDWNAENFSFYSDENRRIALESGAQGLDLDAGGRLLDAIVRPCPIATAGTPVELTYDLETSLFTYRFRSPTHVSAQDQPSPNQITEVFLPSRVYKESDIECLVSPGGKVKLDLENSRAYIWFNDANSLQNRKPEQPRRIDIWVPSKAYKTSTISTTHILIALVALIVIPLLAWELQQRQWELERLNNIRVSDNWWF